MNRVFESRQKPPHTAPLGIAVNKNGTHIGILYRVDGSKDVHLLHLGWHEDLRCEPPDANRYLLWVRPNVPRDRAMAVATFCRRVWKQNGTRVPYGFSDPRGFFDTNGKVLKGPARVGLTCATFVLAIFHQTGLPLIEYESWPNLREDDVAWQSEVLKTLADDVARGQLSESHKLRVKNELGNVRYRPLEVAGAGACDVYPAAHEAAGKLANFIRDKLASLS